MVLCLSAQDIEQKNLPVEHREHFQLAYTAHTHTQTAPGITFKSSICRYLSSYYWPMLFLSITNTTRCINKQQTHLTALIIFNTILASQYSNAISLNQYQTQSIIYVSTKCFITCTITYFNPCAVSTVSPLALQTRPFFGLLLRRLNTLHLIIDTSFDPSFCLLNFEF